MIYFLIIVTVVYVLLMLFLVFGFGKVETFEAHHDPKISFSIVVPFRNEAENLPQLFSSLEKLQYPVNLYEILLVDDASSDDSAAICENFRNKNLQLNISVLKNENLQAAKKGAIETAVNFTAKKYILTTDADCTVPPQWLQEMNSFILESNAKLVAAPVVFKNEKSALSIFQTIDFMSLQAATIGGFGVEKAFMCNGANFCYEKKAFLEFNGFSGNEKIASGDDVFLLQKMQAAGLKIGYLKSRKAIVESLPQKIWKDLINQRMRWAAKASAYKSSFGKFVGIVVFLMNFSLLVGGIAAVLREIPSQTFFLIFLFKFNVDFMLIYKAAVFFKNEKVLKNYFWCSFLYPVFSSYIALISLFTGYSWKGRNFRR